MDAVFQYAPSVRAEVPGRGINALRGMSDFSADSESPHPRKVTHVEADHRYQRRFPTRETSFVLMAPFGLF